jgi:hypothetical protein
VELVQSAAPPGTDAASQLLLPVADRELAGVKQSGRFARAAKPLPATDKRVDQLEDLRSPTHVGWFGHGSYLVTIAASPAADAAAAASNAARMTLLRMYRR